MFATRRSRYLGALAAATVGAALAQDAKREVAIEAESMSYEGGRTLFKGPSISDGTVSIRASEGAATPHEQDEATLQFSGAVEVTFARGMIAADSATFRFAAGRLTEGEVTGGPVAFEAATEGPTAFRGTAGRITYDRSLAVLTAREGATFAYDNKTVRNCNWTYSLNDGAFSGFPNHDDKCVVSVTVPRESQDAAPR